MSRIKANNININYELEGSGKSIVFVHGLSDSLLYWKGLGTSLKDKYQCLAFDLRAHGETDSDENPISIDLYTEDLYCLIKALDISDAVFIGLSLGGNIALNFALKHPEMVNGLIIMSSFSEMTEDLEKIFNDFNKGIENGFEGFYDIILPYTLTEEMLQEHKETLEFIKHEAAKTANIEGIKAGINAGYNLNLTEDLNKINVPAIVISGKEDDLTDLDVQKKIHDNMKDSEWIILENTKHNLLIGDNVSYLIELIDEFMKKID